MTCELHKVCRPHALTHEAHHVVPRAWQGLWVPVEGVKHLARVNVLHSLEPVLAGSPVLAVPDSALWDRRTVECCPTGHRNVHHYLVQMMHTGQDDPDAAVHEVRRFYGGGGSRNELEWARQALARWLEWGGVLEDLRAAGQWGAA